MITTPEGGLLRPASRAGGPQVSSVRVHDLGSVAMLVHEFDQPGENVDIAVLAHEHVLMAVVGENMKFMTAGNYFLKSLMIDDV